MKAIKISNCCFVCVPAFKEKGVSCIDLDEAILQKDEDRISKFFQQAHASNLQLKVWFSAV